MRTQEKLIYTNERGESIEFSPASSYHVNFKDVTGLSDVRNAIYSTNSMGQDGDTYLGYRMKKAYPIVMTQGKEFVVVFVPDFNINTQGKDVPDAIEMARDAIGLMGIDMQDDGEALPEASSIASAQAEAPSGAIVSLVDVDFAEYRRKNDMRVVKKNCTIPSWLNFEAERAGVNFSAVLQAALKSELHITSR